MGGSARSGLRYDRIGARRAHAAARATAGSDGRTGPPAAAPATRPYLVVAAVVVVVSLAGFAAAEVLQVPVFTHPATVLDGSGAVAAVAFGTALLVGDVVAHVRA
jgi:hypothetical protein